MESMNPPQRKLYRARRKEKKKEARIRSAKQKGETVLDLTMGLWSDQQEAAAATIIYDLEPGEESVAESVGKVGGASVDEALLCYSTRTERPIRARDGTFFAGGVGGLRGQGIEKLYEAGQILDARGSMTTEAIA